jgi:hypothetical protein
MPTIMHLSNPLKLFISWLISITGAFSLLAIIGVFPLSRAAAFMRIGFEDLLIHSLIGMIIGLLVGISQWLVLRHFFSFTLSWVVATVVGFAVGWLIGLPIANALMMLGSKYIGQGGPPSMLGYGLSIGVSVALSQWVFFRSSVKHASWWLVITMFGWTIAWTIKIPLPVDHITRGIWLLVILMNGLIVGSVYGSITGIGLVFLGYPWSRTNRDTTTH